MNESLSKDLAVLYEEDVTNFINNLKEIPEDKLWDKPNSIPNSAGILAQHIAGNLNYYIGAVLGETEYKRNREAEFTISHKSKKELIDDLENVIEVISLVLPGLSEEQLNAPFPANNSKLRTTRKALLFFYRHLNYHLGQLNYLKRLLNNHV